MPAISVCCLAGVLGAACRIALPPVLDVSKIVAPKDRALREMMGACQSALNRMREQARSASRFSDIGVITMGGLAATSSASAAAIPDSSYKMASSIVAALSGFGALLFKLPGSPTFLLQKHFRASQHWEAAMRVIEVKPGLDPVVDRALFAYSMAQLRECLADSPTGRPPTVPIQTYLLSVDRVGEGVVRSEPGGIDCGEVCSSLLPAGTRVNLRAAPSRATELAEWTEVCAGTQGSICSFHLQGPAKAGLRFKPRRFTLRVAAEGAGSGEVVSSPEGIDCGSSCVAAFDGGTKVRLVARPAGGSFFRGWKGCTGDGPVCTLIKEGDQVVTASFARIPRYLTVSRVGEGEVRGQGAGILCGTTCAARLEAGASVHLEALPGAGWTFLEWAGACAGKEPTCSVKVERDLSIMATFVRQRQISVRLTGRGQVASQPPGIRCPETCAAAHARGAAIVLEAKPEPGWSFSGWAGKCEGPAPTCSVVLDADVEVSATFVDARDRPPSPLPPTTEKPPTPPAPRVTPR